MYKHIEKIKVIINLKNGREGWYVEQFGGRKEEKEIMYFTISKIKRKMLKII